MGVILDPLNRLRHTLASCVHVSDWMGHETHDIDTVADRIYFDGIDVPDKANDETLTPEAERLRRPYIIIYPSEDSGYIFERRAAPNCWNGSGSAICVLSREYTPSKSLHDHFIEAAGFVEKIISCDEPGRPGLQELAIREGYLAINRISLFFAGRTPHEEIVNYGDAYDVVFVIEYGSQ